MMASQPVQPLRILKSTSSIKSGNAIPRPLSELTPSDKRRNSPSFNIASSKALQTMTAEKDSSPFQSSPFNTSDTNTSPRLFWQGRDPATPTRFNSENVRHANRSTSPSPARRTSIERLQKASRVKNSNMFARERKEEYDPAALPDVQRPLAKPVQSNAFGNSLSGFRTEGGYSPKWSPTHKRSESTNKFPLHETVKSPLTPRFNINSALPDRFPSRDQISPTKSSMSQRHLVKGGLDIENGSWSDEVSEDEHELPDGHMLRRQVKSVTFDHGPPQINEYEMTTPDMSSIGSESRETSYDSAEEDDDGDVFKDDYDDPNERDDSFDASLEDTSKTPVVEPDDWHHAGPETRTGLFDQFEDPFDGPEDSPMPGAEPASAVILNHDTVPRESSDHRPLPPLPPSMHVKSPQAAIGRTGSEHRNLPQPPTATSTSDLAGTQALHLPHEDHLNPPQDLPERTRTPAEEQRERRMRRAAPRQNTVNATRASTQVHEDEDTLGDLTSYMLPGKISRDSILRKMAGQDSMLNDSEYHFSSPPASPKPASTIPDPDIPLPTTEEHSILELEDETTSALALVDVSFIAELHDRSASIDGLTTEKPQHEREVSELGAMIFQDLRVNDEVESESDHSAPTPTNPTPEPVQHKESRDNHLSSPILGAAIQEPKSFQTQDHSSTINKAVSLPEFTAFLGTADFGLGLQDYMTPSPPTTAVANEPQKAMSMSALNALLPGQLMQRPLTPQQQVQPSYDGSGWGADDDEFECSTPESVIHHPIMPASEEESIVIPDRTATIKGAKGSKLKTRPSNTPAELAAMRDVRRQISGEHRSVPPIPEKHRNRPSFDLPSRARSGQDHHSGDEEDGTSHRKPSFKRSMTLELDNDLGRDVGLGLDEDFDRVIETSKRGYLMRQNTKLVVATSDNDMSPGTNRYSRSAGNSPAKAEARPQSWVVEPWNGSRRKSSASSKIGNGQRRKADGIAPPLPGQESVLSSLHEEEPSPYEHGQRGCLFVKVIGVKDLDLPLPKHERSWFSLTLDNGVHCVTTAWLELGKNAPIGQEFELVVQEELEFQLTLNVKLEKPAPRRMVESPTKFASPKKTSTLSRVFASPKKRKELELQFREEERRHEEEKRENERAARLSAMPTTWDLLTPLAAEDGTFGRSYICLKEHEAKCFGRPYVVDVPAFNEWATADTTVASSVKSKRGHNEIPRRSPYKVGKLELQLLFVPKPKGVKEDDMPKSMNACIRQMREAEASLARSFEGHLSQQGGDCPYWRRRFFRLNGSKLTAYHESTMQPRATINLANASKLIDDRSALTKPSTSGKNGSRRKSGFAEEEEGYMFVEEGFRVRFNNGEVIDFYADNKDSKDSWMLMLEQCVGKEGKESGVGKWCEQVLRREESIARKQARKVSGRSAHSRTKSALL